MTKYIVAALIVACTTALPQAAPVTTIRITPPNVPVGLEVPAGHKPYLVGHAIGTQNYICTPSATSPTGVAWMFVGPQATVFSAAYEQILTHFLSENPLEITSPPTFRAEWQHSRDTSAVWAKMDRFSSDPNYVLPGAIDWLRLVMVGTQSGPTGGAKMTVTTYIQRVNTVGGKAPATGCTGAGDVNNRQMVPYEADYYFYMSE